MHLWASVSKVSIVHLPLRLFRVLECVYSPTRFRIAPAKVVSTERECPERDTPREGTLWEGVSGGG